jgi:hypothetical protein
MKRLVLILSVLSSLQSIAQTTIQFKPVFKNEALVLEQPYCIGKDSVQFETLRFYISDVVLLKNGKTVFTEENSYHLLDAANERSMSISLYAPASVSYDAVQFNLGIDSIVNASGALGGDLDPVKGMYWTWQSGYINYKLEGKSNLCATRKNAFQFHLGGYMSPYLAVQQVQLAVNNAKNIVIHMPLDKFIEQADLRKQNTVMIPCAEAVTLSKTVAQLFIVAP